jgi:hypothetical protein
MTNVCSPEPTRGPTWGWEEEQGSEWAPPHLYVVEDVEEAAAPTEDAVVGRVAAIGRDAVRAGARRWTVGLMAAASAVILIVLAMPWRAVGG